ncbi:MAG: hypothetical protein OXB88_06965, partial [Bacteriovoracales bacterium]|nr:hypothetical protein [Bacteriovoracales bacterium]
DLLLVSGTNLLRTLGKTFTSSPADSIQDLREAKVIMTQNIRSLDRLFSDSMVPMILEYKFISERNENSDFTITVNSLKRYFKDSINWDMSGAGLVWNMLYHKDRYPYYFLSLDPYKMPLQEDAHDSYEQSKSRLCIQSLAFQDIDKFSPHCLGSILRTPYTTDQSSYYLSASYNRLLLDYINEKSGPGLPHRTNRARICALRDYHRRNTAHYLQVLQ